MTTVDDPAVREAMRRRHVRGILRVKSHRINWTLLALLPIPLSFMHSPFWWSLLIVLGAITGPLFILWLMYCTCKLSESFPREWAGLRCCGAGIGIFLGLVLLNLAGVYIMFFVAETEDWLISHIRGDFRSGPAPHSLHMP